LRRLVQLLPTAAADYDPKFVVNVIKFLVEKIKLDGEDRQNLLALNAKLAQK
jgi:hypothetical protein